MNENKNIEFYGGKAGPWIPIILLIIGMIAVVIMNKTDFYVYTLLTLGTVIITFFMVKDKKSFGDVCIGGLKDDMLAILIIAFMLAGILSQLLRGSGLVEALIHLASLFDMPPGIIPLIAFLICCLISTSCGTSSGSIVAVFPVMMPIGVELGCDASLVAGAIISGALFGDNLAPISDTTIASAVTQEQAISDVVRTRLPYSLIAGAIAAVFFLVFGFMTSDAGITNIPTDGSTMPALALLIVPVVMIIMMKKGWDLAGTLIVCDVLAIIIDVALGLIAPQAMITAEGPIIGGINGMVDMIIFCMFFFIIIESMRQSGAMDTLAEVLLKYCKGIRSVQIVIIISSVFGTIATAGSSTGITFVGPMANKIAKKFNIKGTRVANLLDATACSTCGFVPFCTPYLLSLSLASDIEGIPDDYSYLSILKYVFHPIFLMILFIGSIFIRKINVLNEKPQNI